MPTNLTDHTAERRGEKWNYGVVKGVLESYHVGTVCFPLGYEFGCGIEKEFGVEKERSLEASIGAEHQGISGELKVGTKITESEKWTIKSERCEWCSPELCYPNSRVETWTCSGVWTLYLHSYNKTYFYPGPRGQMATNCKYDAAKCSCYEQHTTSPTHAAAQSPTGTAAMVIHPMSFLRRRDRAEGDASVPLIASEFAELYCGDVIHPKFAGHRYGIAVAESGEPLNWLYPASNGRPRLSLLSRNRSDLVGSSEPNVFTHGLFPVLAAAPYVREPSAIATITLLTNAGEVVKLGPQSMNSYRGLFTLFVTEFDLKSWLPTISELSLELRLMGETSSDVDQLTRAYQRTPF